MENSCKDLIKKIQELEAEIAFLKYDKVDFELAEKLCTAFGTTFACVQGQTKKKALQEFRLFLIGFWGQTKLNQYNIADLMNRSRGSIYYNLNLLEDLRKYDKRIYQRYEEFLIKAKSVFKEHIKLELNANGKNFIQSDIYSDLHRISKKQNTPQRIH